MGHEEIVIKESRLKRKVGIQASALSEQARVEFAILLGTEEALRAAFNWFVQPGLLIHKISTLRFLANSFGHHLTRIIAIADHGSSLHRDSEPDPYMISNIQDLRFVLHSFRSEVENAVVRLDFLSPSDKVEFAKICAEFEVVLDDFRFHGLRVCKPMPHLIIASDSTHNGSRT